MLAFCGKLFIEENRTFDMTGATDALVRPENARRCFLGYSGK
jgi:hypothetical protein